MKPWTIWTYESEEGVNQPLAWIDALDPAARSNFHTAIRILRATSNWKSRQAARVYKDLTKRHAGLGEIIFDVDIKRPGAAKTGKRHFRPIGLLRADPDVHDFVMFAACEKVRGLYTPRQAFDDAVEHRRSLERGLGKLHEYKPL